MSSYHPNNLLSLFLWLKSLNLFVSVPFENLFGIVGTQPMEVHMGLDGVVSPVQSPRHLRRDVIPRSLNIFRE
jgi:hypothetical protein